MTISEERKKEICSLVNDAVVAQCYTVRDILTDIEIDKSKRFTREERNWAHANIDIGARIMEGI